MKKILDKLIKTIKVDKNIVLFFVIILVIGILSGSLLVTILNDADKKLISDYYYDFLSNIKNTNYFEVLKDNAITGLIYILGIWLLGISVIGIPIIVFLFFSKCFTLGFSIGTIFYTQGIKGILNVIVFSAGQFIFILSLLFLALYALSFSFFLIYSLVKKKTIDFKIMINKYLIVLAIVLVIFLITLMYDTYLMPYLIENIGNLIK